jgi:hypothetical protein
MEIVSGSPRRSRNTSVEDLRAWLKSSGAPADLNAADREGESEYFQRITGVVENPESLDGLRPGAIEKAVMNVAGNGGTLLRRVWIPFESKARFIAACPNRYRHLYARQTEYSSASDMFWDGLIGRSTLESAVRQAIFGALVDQLGIPNRWCQYAALHGFNHLRDLRCQPVVDRFLATCTDPALHRYAEAAKRFQAL